MDPHARKSPRDATKKKHRVRLTNKATEAQRFSTVRTTTGSGGGLAVEAGASSKMHEPDGAAAATVGFDPIPGDGMFNVVQESKYWPPPKLEDLLAEASRSASAAGANAHLSADGMDLFDRRSDDAAARREKLKVARVMGEVSHPRGKAPKNVKMQFSDDEESDA